MEWAGVEGPGDDGVLGKYSEPVSSDGVRHMDGIGESSEGDGLGEERSNSSSTAARDVEHLSWRGRRAEGRASRDNRDSRDRRGQLVGENEPIDSQPLTTACKVAQALLGRGAMAEKVVAVLECLRRASGLTHPDSPSVHSAEP